MNTKVLNTIEKDHLNSKLIKFNVGDSISVSSVIDKDKDGKERIQIFKGIVLKIKGAGAGTTFTVRKIAQGGIGVEKTMLLYSPTIKKIEFLKKGKVRRAKLYYMRKRIGKSALKIMEGVMTAKELKELEEAMKQLKEEEKALETQTEGEVKQEENIEEKKEEKPEEKVEEKKEEVKDEVKAEVKK